MKLNKKGYINDIVTGTGMLFGFFIVLALCIFILLEWNDGIQNSAAFTEQAKQGQQDFTDQYPSMMGWLFPASMIGLILYTLITAYLVEVISKVWFIIGFIVTIIQAIVGYVIQQAYSKITEMRLFETSLAYIPGAVLYFENIILFNAIWGFLILLVLYFKRDA